jgi:cobalt-zinc-cadmium efflux system protein
LWSLDGENHIFTAHVVLCTTLTPLEVQATKEKIKKLTREYGIVEATIETELAGMTCVDPVHK